MDPEAALQAAERAIDNRRYRDAAEYLKNYWRWRGHGGFEPANGDERARKIERRLGNTYIVPAIGHWDMLAGGIGALEGTHGYRTETGLGDYVIDPPQSRGVGYGVRFENVRRGRPGAGLHIWIAEGAKETSMPTRSRARTAAQAATWARKHYAAHRKAAGLTSDGKRPTGARANGRRGANLSARARVGTKRERSQRATLNAALRRDA